MKQYWNPLDHEVVCVCVCVFVELPVGLCEPFRRWLLQYCAILNLQLYSYVSLKSVFGQQHTSQWSHCLQHHTPSWHIFEPLGAENSSISYILRVIHINISVVHYLATLSIAGIIIASMTLINVWDVATMILTGENRNASRETCPSTTLWTINPTQTGL